MPNSQPKAATPHKPEIFNPIVQTKVPVSRPAVYKPAERATQFKPASGLAAAATGKQSATWPPVYRPVSSGIQNKTSPADFKLGAPKSHKPPITVVGSKAAGTNLIGPPIYRPSSIQPKAAGAPGRKSPFQTARIPLLTSKVQHMSLPVLASQVVQASKAKKSKKAKKEAGAEKAKTRRIRVNGDPPPGTTAVDGEDSNAITSPDNDPNVTNTTSDGEVALLISALGQFYHSLDAIGRKTVNRPTSHTFELEIENSWGPCDGCKKRLGAFGRLWRQKANSVLQAGEKATLTITFRYQEPAKEFQKTGGWSTVYGWYNDGDTGPCEHTLTYKAQGT